MEFAHIPVLLEQCLDGLDIKPDGIYFDGTCGGAGHSREIAKRLTTRKTQRSACTGGKGKLLRDKADSR